MAICAMKKLSLIAAKSDRKSILDALMWLGEVEVSNPEKVGLYDRYSGLLDSCSNDESEEKYKAIADEFKSALDAVGKYRKKSGGLFAKKPVLTREQFEALDDELNRIVDTVSEINAIALHRNELKIRLNSLDTAAAQVRPWKELSLPLNFRGTSQSVARMACISAQHSFEVIKSDLEAEGAVVESINRDNEFLYLWVIYHSDDDEAVLQILNNKYSYVMPDFSEYGMTAAERLISIAEDKTKINDELDAIEERLKKLSDESEAIERSLDFINSRIDLIRLKYFSMQSDYTFLLEGWVCTADITKLEKALGGYEVFCELTDPTDEDDVPVRLKNNKLAAPFESIIGMYSYPKYGSVDPTFVMAIFYFIIFGFMLGDAVYGLLMSIGCFAAVKLMHAKGNMKNMLLVFGISGISMIIAGVLMGSYLGDLPIKLSVFNGGKELTNIAILFDPMKNPMAFLVLSLAIGVVHILSGLALKFYGLCKKGQVFDALCDVGSWYVLFFGIIFFGLGAYFDVTLMATVGKYLCIAGVVLLILTQGRDQKNVILKFVFGVKSLYDLVGYASDILSYSRILALGLSSAVIASVINTMATMSGPSVIGVIMMVLILLLGHVINFALNLLGTFVHTSRLQYIEFFGRFYEDGGEPFAPQKINPKYLEILEEGKSA